MRSVLWGIVVASSTLAGWLVLGAGCGALPTECAERYTCPPGVGGGASASSASSSTSTGVGGDSGPPLTCVPTAGMDPVADMCGIFVSSSLGDDVAGVGSKEKPYKTLAMGIKTAGPANKPVYACAETFTETLSVAVGVGLYGGLDCKKSWGYVGDARSTLTAEADAVPLTLSNAANGVALFDFKVTAVDAVIAGGSSIAVIADQVTASFTRCDLIAGNGMAGLAGVMSTDNVGPTVDTTDPAIRGNNGVAACMDKVQSLGGASKPNDLCPSSSGGPLGGAGGPADTMQGSNGGSIPPTTQTALGGTGQGVGDPTLSCVTGSGQPGAPGMAGGDGAGASGASAIGQLAISGYAGVAGKIGFDGKAGQGGGGGGGAKGKALCAGATGGGGGTGGCGGHGGSGGNAGGASIALVSLGATLSFDTVSIALGAGGAGGDGGDGQFGGVGGFGGFGGAGNGTLAACPGGVGGAGGTGGKGGGGHGGHAIGIAATGNMLLKLPPGVIVSQKGTAGLGGKGGPSQDGDSGVQAEVKIFP